MEVQEFDNALTDLETRVDRLRALYENWFRGYEKTEPSVARKDVERRVYGLRKELPRNTALRFRYHQLYQRFSTLANYWQRTARQVEEGTYRMQLQRMRRRKDEQAARSLAPPTHGEEQGELPEQKSYELNLDETLDVGSLLDDFELDQVARAIDGPAPHAELAAPSRPIARFRLPGSGPTGAPPARPSLSLDHLQSFGGIAALTGSSPDNDGQTTAPPPRGSLPSPTLPASRASLAEVTGRPPANVGAPGVSAAAGRAPVVPAAATARPGTPAQPAGQAPARPSPPLPQSHAATVANARPLVPAPPPASAARAPMPPPPVPRAPAPPPPARAAPPASPAASGTGAISDQQIRRIYDDYVAARRKNNEGDVRYETLASSINKMLPDLQKRHQGKRIDFEIVLKDGRVGLKPKAT